MIFKFLISIVFIAEIVLTVSIIRAMIKLDNIILSCDGLVTNSKSGIKDVSVLCKKISEQIIELSEQFVQEIRKKEEDILLGNLNKLILALIIWKFNLKAIKRFRKTKLCKTIGKGLSVLGNMI